MTITDTPTWLSDLPAKTGFPKLTRSLKADVVIVGGGIAGITTAYLLSKLAKKVVLVEKNTVGSGITAYTTAFLTAVVDTDYAQLIENFGLKTARMVWESHLQAIDFIEQTAKKESISCEFTRVPNYLYSVRPNDNQGLLAEQIAYQDLGVKVEFKQDEALKIKNFGYLEIKNQAKFHPLKYLLPLSKITAKNGVQIFENSEVTGISGQDPVTISTAEGQIETDWVILATHNPLDQSLETFLKKGFYETYVLEAKIPGGSLPEAIYEDSLNPYHYLRIDGDRLIIGGEDHRQQIKIDHQKNYRALEDYLKALLPDIKYKITRKWGGPIIEPVDGLAYIGSTRENNHQLIATAFSGSGMTYGTISGLIFKDLISGQKNPWAQIYDPKRIPTIRQLIAKGIDFTGEFFGGAWKKLF